MQTNLAKQQKGRETFGEEWLRFKQERHCVICKWALGTQELDVCKQAGQASARSAHKCKVCTAWREGIVHQTPPSLLGHWGFHQDHLLRSKVFKYGAYYSTDMFYVSLNQ